MILSQAFGPWKVDTGTFMADAINITVVAMPALGACNGQTASQVVGQAQASALAKSTQGDEGFARKKMAARGRQAATCRPMYVIPPLVLASLFYIARL